MQYCKLHDYNKLHKQKRQTYILRCSFYKQRQVVNIIFFMILDKSFEINHLIGGASFRDSNL